MAVRLRPQLLPSWASRGHLSVFTTWQLVSPRVRDPKEVRRSPRVSGVASGIACHHFCCVLLATQTHPEWGDYKRTEPGGQVVGMPRSLKGALGMSDDLN